MSRFAGALHRALPGLKPHITAAATLALVASLLAACSDALALTITTPSPIHSYYEGLRGRLPFWTAAAPDDPVAVWTNPALLGTGRALGFTYLHTHTKSTFSGDDAFALSVGGLGFGAELMDLRESAGAPRSLEVNRYTIASGQRLAQGVYFGTTYSWHTSRISELDGATTWSAGLLVRPHRMMSVGVVGRDLNSPTYYGNKFRPILEAAIGFRPVDERLTIFAGYLARRDELEVRVPDTREVAERQPKSFFSYGLEVEPADGVILRVGGDQDENFSASVGLELANAGITSVFTREKSDKNGNDTYGTVAVTASPFWRESALMPRNGYLEIGIKGSIAEARPPFSLLAGDGPTYTLRELAEKIDRAKRSPEIRAIVLKCTGVSFKFAVCDELRQALADFRASGKKVVAYTETPGNGEYCLVTAADYVVMTPNGYLGLVGLKSEVPFLKGTMDKLGLEAKYTKAGKYKSAVETLTQDQFSEPSREAEEALLDDVYAKLVADIAEGRGMSEDQVRLAIDNGPYLPADAAEAGLVDTVAYWDEIPDIVETVMRAGSRSIPYKTFAQRVYDRPRWDEPPAIGIVYAVGSITGGENRQEMFLGQIMGSETTTEALKAMREDRSVKAVVLRVDSPGGQMAASDLIRREVELTKKEKPVIVSMGGLAASGGYHISCSADKILADEATLTGSIGVFNLWVHTRGLYQKLGINKEIMTRGRHADPMPTWRDVTEEDMSLMQRMVDQFYGKFVTDVASGRGMTYEEVDSVAQGRVWSGRAALRLGLVDGIGGLRAAIALARQEAGIPADQEVDIKVLPRAGGLLEALMSGVQTRVLGRAGQAALPTLPPGLKGLLEEAAYAAQFEDRLLYLMPYELDIQ
ncbi:MAG: signal peptide peptidase SppA [bacterium]